MNQNNHLKTMMITTFDKQFEFWTSTVITRMNDTEKQQVQFFLFHFVISIVATFLDDASLIDFFPIFTSTSSNANWFLISEI